VGELGQWMGHLVGCEWTTYPKWTRDNDGYEVENHPFLIASEVVSDMWRDASQEERIGWFRDGMKIEVMQNNKIWVYHALVDGMPEFDINEVK